VRGCDPGNRPEVQQVRQAQRALRLHKPPVPGPQGTKAQRGSEVQQAQAGANRVEVGHKDPQGPAGVAVDVGAISTLALVHRRQRIYR